MLSAIFQKFPKKMEIISMQCLDIMVKMVPNLLTAKGKLAK